MHILELKNGSFSYPGSDPVFQNVSFSVEKGQVLSILGPNGAGKSSLLSCLACLNRLTGGELFLKDRPASALNRRQLSRIIGFVPQILSSVYAYSVWDYVVMGRAPYISSVRRPSEKDYLLAKNAIERMGIAHLAQRSFSALSGGERQQTAIARTLVQNPDLILLDEPTSALDFGNQVRVLRMVRELTEQGYSVIMTTHNPNHAMALGGVTGVMNQRGELIVGRTEEIIEEKFLSEVYQVELRISYVDELRRKACFAVF